jgi:hypothetical protein
VRVQSDGAVSLLNEAGKAAGAPWRRPHEFTDGPAEHAVADASSSAMRAADPAWRPAVSDLPRLLPAPGFVGGEGVARAEPDRGHVTTGVLTRGNTAQDAQEENNRLMQAVLQALRARGIAEADVRTNGLALTPVNDPGTSRIAGYEASNQVRVTVREVRRVGEVLDAAVDAGANQAGEVRFAVRDDAPLRRQALDQAVKAARSTAQAIAASGGLRIVGVQTVVDESATGPVFTEPQPAQLDPATRMPVQPGQVAVTARVRVVYQIQ